jgi:hypothetical protein
MHVAFIAAIVAGLGQQSVSASTPCSAATLRSSEIAVGDVRGLTTSVLEPDSLKLVSAKQFDRPCAALLQNSIMGSVQLADGRAFREIDRTGRYEVRNAAPFEDVYDRRTIAERSDPRVADTPLRSSDRVNARRVGGDFVGVWKIGGSWRVQSFSQRDDRTFTQPRAVFASSLPIRSVMYFPGPDTPSGRLEVIQEQPNGTVRTLAFDWWHGSAFERR